MLEERGQPYVLAVRSNHHLRFLEEDWTLIQTDPATIADDLDEADRRGLSAGEGSKGPRLYHWARVSLGLGHCHVIQEQAHRSVRGCRSSGAHRILPSGHGISAELVHRLAGCQVPLDIEGVVDGGMG
jgi:hypothetical protein